jgi:DNA ligase-1
MRFGELCAVYDALARTPKRLEKTWLLSQFLRTVSAAEMEMVIRLLEGRVFPPWDSRVLGFSTQLAVKALARATGQSADAIMQEWKARGDLGDVAESLCKEKKQVTLFSQELTTQKVSANLRKLAGLEGIGMVSQKVALVAELLSSATPLEARYVLRIALEDLRIGLGEGTLRDALVWAFEGERLGISYNAEKNDLDLPDREPFNVAMEQYQDAIDLSNDFAVVAALARQGGMNALDRIALEPGRPVKAMLYQKAIDIIDALATVGTPAAAEYKYDGFRMQIHIKGGQIALWTRRLEDVTAAFPDVVDAVRASVVCDSAILDAEAVGIDKATGRYMAFQKISQRIKRKYDIDELRRDFPVELNIFDILYLNGQSTLRMPFAERRKLLVRIVPRPQPGLVMPAQQVIINNAEDGDRFYRKSLAAGNEGIMVKNLNAIYKPGSRVGFGMKVKPTLETLEVVIVGAELGEGKRSEWLATFVIAVRDPDTDEIVEIGRVGTGFKEKDEEGVSFRQMTELLRPLILSEEGRVVRCKPLIVIEVDYEEIQKSPTYSSGYALRFPRFVRLREDRGIDDIATLEDVERLYGSQRGRGRQA